MKKDKELNLGLDIGTNSVGWALLDEDNKLIKKNRFTFWGVRMFEESKDASSTRIARNSRRRLRRRNERIKIIRSIFAEEISKVDKNFFMKMDDSFFNKDDKRNQNEYGDSFGLISYNKFQKNIDENDPGYIFYKKCPTIFHLRKMLVESNKKEDIRLVYLAIHHLIKYRGNFLTPGDEFKQSDTESLKNIFEEFNNINNSIINANDETEGFETDYFEKIKKEFNSEFFEKLEAIINDKYMYKKQKQEELLVLFGTDKNTLCKEYFIPLLVGSKVNISSLKPVKGFKYDKSEIDITKANFEEDIEKNISNVPGYEDLFAFVLKIKEISDFFYLKKLLKGESFLCDAMINKYNEHHKDLNELKRLVKKYDGEEYFDIFRKVANKSKKSEAKLELSNYPAYIGRNNLKNKTQRFKHASRTDFYKYIKPIIEKICKCEAITEQDRLIADNFIRKIENNDFLLRQDSDQNGSLPMQLGLKELKVILKNQSTFYPFLNEISDGISNIDKIVMTYKFKIPYYVGPLSTNRNYSKNSWLIKKNNVKITPWNFDEVVDKANTAEAFINRMQNKCTYLKGDTDYCLPKKSMIFSEYDCLSYLNKVKINGEFLNPSIKKDIFDNVFKKYQKPTKNRLLEYLRVNHGELNILSSQGKELPEIQCDMQAYCDLSRILGSDIVDNNFNDCERIIKYITLFEDKEILESKLLEFSFLNANTIKKIKGLNYPKWSSLSKNLIDGAIRYDDNGTSKSILQIMRETNLNLMEILYNEPYKLALQIDKYNEKYVSKDMTMEEFIEENITVSPIMHRPLSQALLIINEIEKIFGRKIDNYYIECNRTNQAKKKQTKSRYETLKELYASCKQTVLDYKELNEKLDSYMDKLSSDKLYLYFTQFGRSMYTNQPIDFNELVFGTKYDIDHIYPQSLIKDDSLSNRVLVEKEFNNFKSDRFLFEVPTVNIYKLKNELWDKLLDKKLITKEKYRRLTRTSMDEQELDGFVNRQIVSTDQSEKALVDILKLYKKVNPNNIIYSKAENVSMFRKENGLVKSRIANNYHHAHDAYLNVVVGKTLNNYYRTIGVNNFKDYEKIKNMGLTINPIKILRRSRSLKGNIITNVESYMKNSNRDDSFKLLWNTDIELGKPEYKEVVEHIVDETGEVVTKFVPVFRYSDDVTQDFGRIYYDLYKRFDIHETRKTNNTNNMLAKVTIAPKNNGSVPLKNKDNPRGNIEKYGGYMSASYSRYVLVKLINKKDIETTKLVAISRLNDDTNETIAKTRITNYLQSEYSKYKSIEVINWNIKQNVIVEKKKTKSYITGVSGGNFLLMNKNDRNFNYQTLCIIKKMEKVNENIKSGKCFVNKNAFSLNETVNYLTGTEIKMVINQLFGLFSKELYAYSTLNSLLNKRDFDFDSLEIDSLFLFAMQLLSYLKTNERKIIDMSYIGLTKNFGIIVISNVEGCKLVSESVTGYYRKVLFGDK